MEQTWGRWTLNTRGNTLTTVWRGKPLSVPLFKPGDKDTAFYKWLGKQCSRLFREGLTNIRGVASFLEAAHDLHFSEDKNK